MTLSNWLALFNYSLYIYIYINTSARAGCDSSSIFETEVNRFEISLPYYLYIAARRIVGWIPFPRVLGQCEMQTDFSRIWTGFTVSISFEGNHHTMITHKSLLTSKVEPFGDQVEKLFTHIIYFEAMKIFSEKVICPWIWFCGSNKKIV